MSNLLVTQEDIQQAKQNIKDYENSKSVGSMLNGAMALSALGSAYGGFSGNKKILYPSMATGFVSGFLRGRAADQEQFALNKMKGMYDIRRAEKNLKKETPFEKGFKKQAVLGGLAEALSGVGKYLFGTPTLTELGGPALPLAIDVIGLPQVAHMTANSTREHAYIAAKDVLGKTLTPSEKFNRGLSVMARSEQMAADKMAPGALKNIRQYLGGLLGPWGSGGQHGETAGKALKEIGKWSPKYRDLSLDAIKDTTGVEKLITTAKDDFGKLHEAGSILNSTIDEIPLARRIMNSTGKTSEGLAKKIIENPQTAVQMATDLQHTVKKTVSGGKALAITTGLMGAGYMLGKIRKKHPLSENELPSKILE